MADRVTTVAAGNTADTKKSAKVRKTPERQREQWTELEIGSIRIVVYVDKDCSAEQRKAIASGRDFYGSALSACLAGKA